MLDGVVKFPPEYAKRYRARGYWQDKSLATEFAAVFERLCRPGRADRRRAALSAMPTSIGKATISRST